MVETGNPELDEFSKKMNRGPSTERLVGYSGITDQGVRISVRMGEIICTAAATKGVQLELPDPSKGDEWLLLSKERVVAALKGYGQPFFCAVLKEARKQVNGSELNGDREIVLREISELLQNVNRPTRFIPPPILGRH